MKKICILFIFCFTVLLLHAQKLKKELDVPTAKEILKLLPDKMKDKNANKNEDKVIGKSGFIGVSVHRNYGQEKKGDVKKNIFIEFINQSPSLIPLNNILSLAISVSSTKYTLTSMNGYPALIQKFSGEDGTINYELLLPLETSLLTLKAPGYDQDELIELANSIPVDKIVKKLEKGR